MIPIDVMLRAIETNGNNIQMVVAIEEMSELQKEICKCFRGQADRNHILEELCDVEIMCKQLELIFGFSPNTITLMKNKKLSRLEDRMNLKMGEKKND